MIESPENYRIVKEEFGKDIGLSLSSLRGATFPLGYFPDKHGIEAYTDVFIIGEAGKFFDSVSGEGIYFALYTGCTTMKQFNRANRFKRFFVNNCPSDKPFG